MRAKKKENSKSLSLAFYFGFFVFLIISISLLFKVVDEIRKSKFDGKNRYTVAVLQVEGGDILSISPREGSLVKLEVKNLSSPSDLRDLGIPADSYIKVDSKIHESPKFFFAKMLINKRKIETDLNILDLIKLSFLSFIVAEDKVKVESSSKDESAKLAKLSSSLFVDEEVLSEKVTIQITNAAGVSGLGSKIAGYVTNMGGNIVLVNSSNEGVGESKIIYEKDSYTLKKISRILEIQGEKREKGTIADIVIIVGKDKEGF